MTRDTAQRDSVAAVFVGLVLGATSAAGIVLLLYTGQGFLRAAGLLVSSTIMAVAAGVWAAAPQPRMSRGRWVAFALALLIAGITTAVWGAREEVRAMASAGAFTVLLVLALPAYTAGLLLAGLQANSRDNAVASSAAAGAATGILLATTVLIQLVQPYGIFYGGGLLVSLTSLLTRTSRTDGDTDMHDHVTLITGVGSAGQLGYAIAERFVTAGARVIITSRGDNVQQLAGRLSRNDDAHPVQADLLHDADVERLIGTITQRYGRLDSLINAAGGLTHIATIADTTPEQWRQEIERNAETALRVCRAALPLLRASHGSIVNFASPAGERASAQLGAYSAGKAAVIALTRALALEEKAHGVRVNAIAPGMMDTEQNRAGATEEAVFVTREAVAAAAFFLASTEARGVSGEVLHVMGPTLA